MNDHMPRTPLSTHLSGSAKETEIRLRNIFSGPKKRPPLPFLILMFSICIFCGNIVSCQMAEPEPVDISEPTNVSEPASSSQGDRSDADRDARLNEMVLDYLRAEYSKTPETFYLAEDAPDLPQDMDIRLDSVHLIGMDYYEEDLYVLYQANHSTCFRNQWPAEWQSADYLVVRMDGQRDLEEVIGRTFYHGPEEDMSTDSAIQGVKDTIRQAIWGLDEFEVSLYREGHPIPLGPGNWVELFPELEPKVEILENMHPIDQPEDRWESWTVDGAIAQRYYSAAESRYFLDSLDTTRTDLYTPKGIRVGSTREQVQEAYPTAKVTDGWWEYTGEDILLYDPDPKGEGRVWLLFLFDGDAVKQITLFTLFN